jgi:hypothetical protein
VRLRDEAQPLMSPPRRRLRARNRQGQSVQHPLNAVPGTERLLARRNR